MTTTEVGYVQLRRGTTAQWASPVNGVPHDGELILIDGVLKIGDGTTPAAALPTGGVQITQSADDGTYYLTGG